MAIKKSMLQRILFGSIMILVLVGVFTGDHLLGGYRSYFSGIILGLIFAPLMAVAYMEYSRMAAEADVKTLNVSGIAGSLFLSLFPVIHNFATNLAESPLIDIDSFAGSVFVWVARLTSFVLPWIGVVVLAIFFEQMWRNRLEDAIRRVACTAFGAIYIGLLGFLLMDIRMVGSVMFLVYVVAMVKFTDIGAYFTGSFVGKHKMIPWLSPGKTWEGLAGGLITAAGIGVGGYYLARACEFDLFVNSPVTAGIMGVTLGIVGQFGDLCESLMKRAAGVKDSGSLLPQFGGVLDLLDSPLIAAPIAYLWLILLKY